MLSKGPNKENFMLKVKKASWMALGMLSSGIAGLMGITFVGMLLFVWFISSGATIDGQHVGGFTQDLVKVSLIYISIILICVPIAIISFKKYDKLCRQKRD